MLPLEIPFPEPSSLADFPHHVSQPGVCSSNFPIDRTLPSLGCSSGCTPSRNDLSCLPFFPFGFTRLFQVLFDLSRLAPAGNIQCSLASLTLAACPSLK